jgi:hypothetical protein
MHWTLCLKLGRINWPSFLRGLLLNGRQRRGTAVSWKYRHLRCVLLRAHLKYSLVLLGVAVPPALADAASRMAIHLALYTARMMALPLNMLPIM